MCCIRPIRRLGLMRVNCWIKVLCVFMCSVSCRDIIRLSKIGGGGGGRPQEIQRTLNLITLQRHLYKELVHRGPQGKGGLASDWGILCHLVCPFFGYTHVFKFNFSCVIKGSQSKRLEHLISVRKNRHFVQVEEAQGKKYVEEICKTKKWKEHNERSRWNTLRRQNGKDEFCDGKSMCSCVCNTENWRKDCHSNQNVNNLRSESINLIDSSIEDLSNSKDWPSKQINKCNNMLCSSLQSDTLYIHRLSRWSSGPGNSVQTAYTDFDCKSAIVG